MRAAFTLKLFLLMKVDPTDVIKNRKCEHFTSKPAHFAPHIASISRITFRFSQITFFIERKRSENSLKSEGLVRGGAGGKVMRENEPVLLVLSVCDGEIILEKGEILSEKRHLGTSLTSMRVRPGNFKRASWTAKPRRLAARLRRLMSSRSFSVNV